MKRPFSRKMGLVGLLAAVATAVALAGCGTGGSSSASGSSGGMTGTLKVAWVTNHREPMSQLIKKFEAAHKGVTIDATYSSVDAYWASLRTELNSGTAPDVMFVWMGNGNPGAQLQFSPDGYLADLSGSPWVSKVSSKVLQNAKYNGKVYAMPLSVEGLGMVINETALAQTGLSVPTTWTQLMNFCSKVNAQGKIPFVLPAQTTDNTLHVAYSLAAGLVYGPNPNFSAEQKAGKVTFSSSAGWHEVFNKVAQMQAGHCFGSSAAGTSDNDQTEELGTGKAIGTFAASGQLPQFTASYSSLKLNLYPMPVSDSSTAAKYMIDSPIAAGAINAKTSHMALAKAFLDYLAQPANDELYATEVASLPLFRPASYKPVASLNSLWQRYSTGVGDVTTLEQAWPNAEVLANLEKGVQEIVGGTASTNQVLQSMDSAYKSG